MKQLLQLKHWQIFTLLIGAPLLFQVITIGLLMAGKSPASFFVAFAAMMLLSGGVFFSWFYALGTRLYKKLLGTVSLNIKLFKVALFTPAIYIILVLGYMLWALASASAGQDSPNAGILLVIIPLHLLSVAGIFYCLRFNAKALKSVELQRPVVLSDYPGELFMIWFFPIGIWIIQPRVNQLFQAPASEQNTLP